jgi:hypothetical protein
MTMKIPSACQFNANEKTISSFSPTPSRRARETNSPRREEEGLTTRLSNTPKQKQCKTKQETFSPASHKFKTSPKENNSSGILRPGNTHHPSLNLRPCRNSGQQPSKTASTPVPHPFHPYAIPQILSRSKIYLPNRVASHVGIVTCIIYPGLSQSQPLTPNIKLHLTFPTSKFNIPGFPPNPAQKIGYRIAGAFP